MKLKVRVNLCSEEGKKFFGEGPYRLLCGVRRLGSLRAAAESMGMAYTKAFQILKVAEQCCGFPLTRRKIGGEGGGGSALTREGEALLLRYETLQTSCGQLAHQLYWELFSDLWAQGPAPGRTERDWEDDPL